MLMIFIPSFVVLLPINLPFLNLLSLSLQSSIDDVLESPLSYFYTNSADLALHPPTAPKTRL